MKDKLKYFTIENTWLKGVTCGWGNGYVIIPKGHSLHGVDYDTLNDVISVHGGLTFGQFAKDCMVNWGKYGRNKFKGIDSESYIVGFDTAHFQDNKENCNKEFVRKETIRLKKQLENLNSN